MIHKFVTMIRKLGINEIEDFDAHMCKIALQFLHVYRKINLFVYVKIFDFSYTIKNAFKNLDKIALHILKKGLSFCFLLSTFSAVVLLAYECFALNPIIFQVGLILFKTSTTFAISFIICAIASDTIKKQII